MSKSGRKYTELTGWKHHINSIFGDVEAVEAWSPYGFAESVSDTPLLENRAWVVGRTRTRFMTIGGGDRALDAGLPELSNVGASQLYGKLIDACQLLSEGPELELVKNVV